MIANHADNKIFMDRSVIVVKRGQKITSLNKLALRWKWSRKKVTNFLEALEQDDMIILKREQGKYTTITIVNYGKYQVTGTTESTTEEQPRNNQSTTKAQPRNINNNDNNVNNDNNDDDKAEYVTKINGLIKNKISSSSLEKFINRFGVDKLGPLINEIERSDYLKENINFNNLNDDFINKAISGKYRTFKKQIDSTDIGENKYGNTKALEY
ncbi:hypothetical protein [Peptoniphilus sp. BV3C26]|nr:hypothetical protein [Peptoniphilus sp. BV3C26]